MYPAGIRSGIPRAFCAHRGMHSNAELVETCTEIINRNPRNLERLRIGKKPAGYGLNTPEYQYWHKLFVVRKQRNIFAEVRHFEFGPVVTASSAEWALRKQLYRGSDASAYINIGRVLAQRCLEAGICEIKIDSALTGEKNQLLVKEMKNNGIILRELHVYKFPNPWDKRRLEKPWEVHE